MSDQLVNELFKSPVVVGIAVVVCIVIIVMIFRSRSEYYSDDEHVKETFELDTKNYNEKDENMNFSPLGTFEEVTRAGDIIENFPSAEMNVMYSDVNGNLATTTDLGLKNLTVSGDSQFGDGKIAIKNGSTIYAPGRMHVHGEELLYILNKSGVIIGKEWGGNGNLNVQGNLAVNGLTNIQKLNVHAGAPWAIPNGKMADGSLTIGDVGKNYGGGANYWTDNTAGLLMECADVTEIAVHDAGTRVASAMFYNGPANTIEVGRNMGWGTSNLVAHGVAIANGAGAQNGWISGNFGLGDKDRVVIGNLEDIATVGSHNKDLNAWKRLRLWGETVELRSNDGFTRMQASGTFYSPGRMHIFGEELLYLLNRSGVIIGKEWGGNGNLDVQGRLAVNGHLDVDGQIWTKNRLSACTEDPWGGAHTGLLVNKGAGGWNTLIHNPNNGSNVHIANGDGYGMHINGGSNNKNTDKYILQCWNGEREVMSVNGKGNVAITGQTNMDRLVVGGDSWGNGHATGLMVRKADDGWQSLIHNIHNESNVHMAHGGGYGMHINAGSNNKNTDNYVLQCWNGEREVMQVNGKGNMFINGLLLQDFIPITINFYGLKMDGTHFDGGGQNRTMVFGGHSTAFVCWLNGGDGNFNHIWAQMVARCNALGLNKACAKHAFDNLTPYSTLTMTIPPGKKVKVWGWDGQGASVFGPGYYCETLQRYPHFIWAGTDAREWDFNIVGSGSLKERTENRWGLFA